MKTFLAFTFALFALTAVQAFNPNITAYNLGFVDQLGLNGTVVEDSIICSNAMTTLSDDINDVIDSFREGPEEILRALLKLVVDFKSGTVQEACNSFNIDVIQYLMQSPDFTNFDNLKDIIHYNYDKYTANVIQQATFGLNQFTHDDESYIAGRTFGYILQVLTGFEIPPTINVNVTVINTTRESWAAFSEGFLTFFNITDDQEIDTFGDCVSSAYNAFYAVSEFPGEFFYGGLTPTEKIQLVRTTIGTILDGVQSCNVGSADVLEQVYEDVIESFKEYPLATLAYLSWNFATKLPEIEATLSMASFELQFMGFAEAGYLYAQDSKMITNFAYDISN